MKPTDLHSYWERFAEDREMTREAMEDVWDNVPDARLHFGGITTFSQCAVAQPHQVQRNPHRVVIAELLMKLGGYVIDTPAKSGARRWKRASS
jgi:hypothetical protein